MRFILFIAFAFCTCIACNSPFNQKPRGFYKINLPEKKYILFDKPGYPYSFEYPVYATVLKDSTFFNGETENPWWINIDFPQLSGKIYISYKEIKKHPLDSLINDAFNLTNKHSIRAENIDDSLMMTPNNIHGVFFTVGGDVATAYQFFLTDSTKNFIRGSLYFDATPQADSLKPVNDFVAEDMRHLINTFRWK